MGFTELVGNIGFYGACLVALALWVDKQIKNHREDTQKTIEMLREDAKEDKERLLDEIAHNRDVLSRVVTTNDMLAKDVSVIVKDLTVKVDKILDKMEV